MNGLAEILRKVRAEIGGMEEEIVDTLRGLVRIPSVVGEEQAAQGFVEGLYRPHRGMPPLSLSRSAPSRTSRVGPSMSPPEHGEPRAHRQRRTAP